MVFTVEPITDCPHIPAYSIDTTINYLDTPCQDCNDTKENWYCLHCSAVYCSRYCKGHMKQHVDESHHCICISFSDLSVWCYQCNDYIIAKELDDIKHRLYVLKFGQEPPNITGSSGSSGSHDDSGSHSK